jgi:cytidine deaminase
MSMDHPSGLTVEAIAQLRDVATRAAHNSYSPYSRFRVGAAILLSDGTVVAGTNVENASYRLTSCAEQSAIAAAVSTYGPAIRIRAVAVANLNGAACMPCGACRQTILEFADGDVYVFYPGANDELAEATIGELLPAAFQLEHLAQAK